MRSSRNRFRKVHENRLPADLRMDTRAAFHEGTARLATSSLTQITRAFPHIDRFSMADRSASSLSPENPRKNRDTRGCVPASPNDRTPATNPRHKRRRVIGHPEARCGVSPAPHRISQLVSRRSPIGSEWHTTRVESLPKVSADRLPTRQRRKPFRGAGERGRLLLHPLRSR